MDLDEVNEYFMRTSLWPAVLFTILMMLIGTFGNALVLVIYRHDFHKSVTWIFIYFLSALDICTCLISMPTELLILFNMVSFPSWPWCKISRYLSYIFHGSSCVILMAIAFNRYDRVCRSASQWINIRKAKIACLGVFLFAAVINIPSLILYGEANVPILVEENTAKIVGEKEAIPYLGARNQTEEQVNITISNEGRPQLLIGRMCLVKSKYSGSPFSNAFFFVQFLMYATLVVLVIYFYSKVIRKMVGYRAKQEKLFKLYLPTDRSSVKEEDETSTKDHLSEDVKTDTVCKDVTTDPLSQSTQTHNETNRNTGKEKKKVEKKENHIVDAKPVTIADVSKTNGNTNITFPILDAEHAGKDQPSDEFNPIQSNKLLSRRIKSVEGLNRAFATIPSLKVPNMDINENSKTPIFLHANKTHKKRGIYESDRRDDRKCNSNEDVLLNTQDDLYLHKERQNYGYGSKSLEVLSTSNIDSLSLADKSMTLNRKSPKGSMKCVLPISGLSVKSVTSYSHEELDKESQEGSKPTTGKTESDEKTNLTLISAAETPEKSSKDEQRIEHKEIVKCKKKLVTQPSVTFSVVEDENPARKRPRSRSSHLDSVSPLFDTPEGNNKMPYIRRTRADSLFTPSLKTVGYNRRMSIKPIKALRTSSMLLIISLAFVLSFLPFWVIVLLRSAIGGGFMSSLGPTGFGVVSVFIRSSLVSNAVNPIVYGLLNSQFRKRCKAIIWRR